MGAGLSADNRKDIEDMVVSLSESDQEPVNEERKLQLYEQLTNYIISALRDKSEKASDTGLWK